MRNWRLIAVLGFLCIPVLVHAQQRQIVGDEATHKELRQLRDDLLAAINKSDLDGMLKQLHNNIVFTAMNGEVCRGHEGVRAYFNRMMTGPNRVVDSMNVNLNVDELTALYGGPTGVAFGTSLDRYKLTSGLQFDVPTRWSATLVKEDGRWLIVSIQSAANLFDNPLLNKAKTATYWAAGTAGIAALLLGFWLGRRSKKAMIPA